MVRRALTWVGTVAVAAGALATGAHAAGPPLPKASNGKPVSYVAGGLTTPTSFAFGDGVIFEGDGGSLPSSPGGIYAIKDGTATRIPGSPGFVSGLAWGNGTLYVAGGTPGPSGATFQILAWSGWTGAAFTKQKVLYTAPKTFQGFNGLALGPDGRLYIGVDVGLLNSNDHGPAKTPFVYDILSMSTNGKGLKVYAKGMRQPWQLTFARGDSSPFVTDFGQDCTGKNPCANNAKPPAVPDFVLHVKAGDNYGFPRCNWTTSSNCKGFIKPFKRFAPAYRRRWNHRRRQHALHRRVRLRAARAQAAGRDDVGQRWGGQAVSDRKPGADHGCWRLRRIPVRRRWRGESWPGVRLPGPPLKLVFDEAPHDEDASEAHHPAQGDHPAQGSHEPELHRLANG